MYLSKRIEIDLTSHRDALLKRPSKVFNKLKAVLTGGLTPTEQNRAELMLTLAQNANVSIRKAGFRSLVAIRANNKLVLEVEPGTEEQDLPLDASVLAQVGALNSIELSIDGETDNLRYLIQVFIDRKAKQPVSVLLYGFIKEFERQHDESEEQLAQRVKHAVETTWSNDERQQKLDMLEAEFEQNVATICDQLKTVFLNKVEAMELEKRVRKNAINFQHAYHTDRYSDVCWYLPLWFITFDSYAETPFDEDHFIIDNDTDRQDGGYAGAGSENDSIFDGSGFDGGFDGGDGGSSCGGGCGGGCGS